MTNLSAWILIAVAVSNTALFSYGWWNLSQQGMLGRILPPKEQPEIPASHAEKLEQGLSGRDLGEMRRLLLAEGFSPDADWDLKDTLRLQQWLGNQVSVASVYAGPESGYELLRLARNGTGMACASMAYMLYDALASLGQRSRVVQLYRSNFDRLDTHVVLEVPDQAGRWVIVDPTYNLTYESIKNRPLGVADLQKLLFTDAGDVKARFHGKRKYPAMIDTYPLDWRYLFSNAFILEPCMNCSFLQRLPPFRFWYGPIRIPFGKENGILVLQHNILYFFTAVIFPTIAGVSWLLGSYLLFRKRQR